MSGAGRIELALVLFGAACAVALLLVLATGKGVAMRYKVKPSKPNDALADAINRLACAIEKLADAADTSRDQAKLDGLTQRLAGTTDALAEASKPEGG